jgi:replicative DNA helicase
MTPEPARRPKPDAKPEELLGNLNQPLPWSDESEKSVLSALMQEPARLRHARQRMRPDAFYQEVNRIVYVELLTMEEAGLPIDPVLLTNRLRDQKKLETVGGPAAMMDLFTYIPSATHFEHYMTDLVGRWKLRQAIHGYAKALHGIQAAFAEGRADTTADGVRGSLNLAGQTVQAFLGDYADSGDTTASLKECLMEHMDYMCKLTDRLQSGENPLIPTGIPTLDKVCGGIGSDEYWLVTGPTKSGKSVLTGNMAVHAARRGVRTKVYTNEVGRRSYAGRILSSCCKHLTGAMDRHGLKERWQQEEYAEAQKQLVADIGKVLLIDNAAGKYVEDIVADIRMEVERGAGLFVVDLIGKIRSRERFGSREQELAHISGSLCNATKTYSVPIIVVSQENDEGQVRESRSLAFDCECWLRLQHFTPPAEKGRGGFGKSATPPEIVQDRRILRVELARGFAAGEKIPCIFDGPRYTIRELSPDESHWTDGM